jgi:hypothetical protein
MPNIELSTYVENLRAELDRCMELSQGKDLRFFTDKVELEVKVGTEAEIGGKGGAKFRFFVVDASLDAEGKKTYTNAQTLKLTLVPTYKGKKGIDIANERPNVGG